MALWKQRKLLAAWARAPEFQLQRLDGGETRLAEIVANGPALLVFFKVSCPVCQLTLPFLARLDSPQGAARVRDLAERRGGHARVRHGNSA